MKLNLVGFRSRIYYPYRTGYLGMTLGLEYASLGQIDSITRDPDDDDLKQTLVTYDYAGDHVLSRYYPVPEIGREISYDPCFGRATGNYTWQNTGTPVAVTDFDYEYDKNSNITSQTFGHRTSDPYNMYTYDALDRLTQADYLVGVLTEDEQFTYDSLGNRTNVNLRNGTNEVYSLTNPNLNNQYTAIGGNSLTHDNAGNMTEDHSGYDYDYDYENRLLYVRDGAVTKAEYTYDALGRRIEKIAGGVTTRYYYDGWRVLTETDENEAVQREYVYGNYLDEVLMMIVDDGPNRTDHYYAHDHLFSPVALIAADGTVEERYEYDAYGKCTIFEPDFSAERNTSSYNNVVAFTGQRLDDLDNGDLLIMYYKNRYYLVDIGRFIQNDPLGVNDGLVIVYFADNGVPKSKPFNPFGQYTDGMNLFEYVKSNPIINIDSYGLWCGVVVKQQDIDWEGGDMGHRWIEGCNSSWGWWPNKDAAGDAKEYWGGTKGELQSPDAKEGLKHGLLWVTGRRLKGTMKFGPKAGTSCKCITECADVCACLRNLRVHGIWGKHVTLWNPEEAAYNYDENGLCIKQGNCRGAAGLFLEACCLKVLHPPKKINNN